MVISLYLVDQHHLGFLEGYCMKQRMVYLALFTRVTLSCRGTFLDRRFGIHQLRQ